MFLKAHEYVIPTEQRDYIEWHRGRKKFALWYLHIEQDDCIGYCQRLTQHFSHLMIQPIQRQPHITIFVCGFWIDPVTNLDEFSSIQFEQQRQQLQHSSLEPVQLITGKIRSFNSSLCVEIKDPSGYLAQLRYVLGQSADEIRTQAYFPHISLGIYRQAYSYDQIMASIDAVEQQYFKLNCSQLYFGYYQPQHLQGPLLAVDTLRLD